MLIERVTNAVLKAKGRRPSRIRLLRAESGGLAEEIPLPVAGAVIGASAECDVVIADPAVSRKHATIVPCDAGFDVTDLASRNGTWLDGAKSTRATVPAVARTRPLLSSIAALQAILSSRVRSSATSEARSRGRMRTTPGPSPWRMEARSFWTRSETFRSRFSQSMLRMLERGEVTPLGARKSETYDVRFVAATHRDLPAEVALDAANKKPEADRTPGPAGSALMSDAGASADVATVGVAVGAALLAAGAVLWLTSEPLRAQKTASATTRLGPWITF